MDRIELLNSIKQKLNIPFVETYNRFAMLWIAQSDQIDTLQDNEFGNKGANEIKMLAGTVAMAANNGGKLNTTTAQRVKHAAISRGYKQIFTELEDIFYWDLIKAIDTGWETLVGLKPRPCDHRIMIQLVCPELFKLSSINDCVLKDDRLETKVLKKWRTKSFKVDRGVLVNELHLYVSDKVGLEKSV